MIWICFLLRGIFYSVLFPLWEGYDEYAHFGFVQHMATSDSLPNTTTPLSKEVEESLKLAPLPWLLHDLPAPHLTHDDYWRLSAEERARRQEQLLRLPTEWSREPGTAGLQHLANWEAQQPPLYYWLLSLPLRAARSWSLPERVILLRLLGLALASLTVPAAFLVARRVLQSDGAGLCAVALIAAMPELMVDICRVGNEGLALLLYSALMYATLRSAESPGRSAFVLLALSLGLGLLTKAYFLTALPALAAILAARMKSESGARARILLHGALATAGALAISGWWYWRNHALTGSWSGVMPDVALGKTPLWMVLAQIPLVDWKSAIDGLFLSHLWFGNWSFLQVRSWIYHAFEWLLVPAIVGLIVLAVLPSRKRNEPHGCVPSTQCLLVPLAFYAFFWLGLLYHILVTYVAQGIPASQGWYLYCLVVAEVLIIVSGLIAISPVRLRPWIVPAATISFILLDLYTVHFLFIPYYSGLTAHRADGGLASFYVAQLSSLNLWDLLARLTTNKPWIGPMGFLAIWASYLVATFALAALSIRLARKH